MRGSGGRVEGRRVMARVISRSFLVFLSPPPCNVRRSVASHVLPQSLAPPEAREGGRGKGRSGGGTRRA